jgi:hypothetical protein
VWPGLRACLLEFAERWDKREEHGGDPFKGHLFGMGWCESSRGSDTSMTDHGIARKRVFAIHII